MGTPRWVGAPRCALQEGRLFEKEKNGNAETWATLTDCQCDVERTVKFRNELATKFAKNNVFFQWCNQEQSLRKSAELLRSERCKECFFVVVFDVFHGVLGRRCLKLSRITGFHHLNLCSSYAHYQSRVPCAQPGHCAPHHRISLCESAHFLLALSK